MLRFFKDIGMNYFSNSNSFKYTSRQFVKNNTSDFLRAQLFVRGNSKLLKVYTDLAALWG